MSEARYIGSEMDLRIRRDGEKGVSTGFASRDGKLFYASMSVAPDAPRAGYKTMQETQEAINNALRTMYKDREAVNDPGFREIGKMTLASSSDFVRVHPGKPSIDAISALAVALTDDLPDAYTRLQRPINAYATDAVQVEWNEVVERDPISGIVRLDTGIEVPGSRLVMSDMP